MDAASQAEATVGTLLAAAERHATFANHHARFIQLRKGDGTGLPEPPPDDRSPAEIDDAELCAAEARLLMVSAISTPTHRALMARRMREATASTLAARALQRLSNQSEAVFAGIRGDWSPSDLARAQCHTVLDHLIDSLPEGKARSGFVHEFLSLRYSGSRREIGYSEGRASIGPA